MRGMTSYARAERRKGTLYFEVILRSLNSKYLEIYIHQMPLEKIFLEEAIKKEIKKKINRGRVEVYFVFRSRPRTKLNIDKDLLHQYCVQTKKISAELNIPKSDFLGDILSLPGVIHLEEKNTIDNNLIFSAVKKALTRLLIFKETEGALIRKEMLKNISGIKENAKKIRERNSSPAANGSSKDIEEEMSLILFYASKLEKVIHSRAGSVKGKTLDFLTQEVLRELNAASSKTKTKQASWWLLEAKTFLERIREQAQNVE